MANVIQHDLKGNDAQLQRVLNRSQRTIKGYGSRVVGVFKAIGTAVVAAFALNIIRRFAGQFIGLLREQEKAEAKLAAILKATGGAAGFTADQLKEYASQLQRSTTFGDEAIINAEALLASFKNIRGDVFLDATKAMLDLSAAMDQDLKGSAVQLGKALNDPIKGVAALSRVGVTFTEKQKQMIKTLVDSGKIMEAQRIILEELNSEFGGTAEALAQTSTGRLQQFSNDMGDLGEEIADALIPALEALLPILEGMADRIRMILPLIKDLTTSFRDWVDETIDGTQSVKGEIGAFDDFLLQTVAVWNTAFGNFEDALTVIGTSIARFFVTLAETVTRSMANIVTAIMNVGTNLGELVVALNEFAQGRGFDPQFVGVTDGMVDVWDRELTDLEKQLDEAFDSANNNLVEDFQKRIAEMREIFKQQQQELNNQRPQGNPNLDFDTGSTGDDDKGQKARIEGLEALNRRIQSAAAGKNPEDKIIAAGAKEAAAGREKLDKVKDAVEEVGDKVEAAVADDPRDAVPEVQSSPEIEAALEASRKAFEEMFTDAGNDGAEQVDARDVDIGAILDQAQKDIEEGVANLGKNAEDAKNAFLDASRAERIAARHAREAAEDKERAERKAFTREEKRQALIESRQRTVEEREKRAQERIAANAAKAEEEELQALKDASAEAAEKLGLNFRNLSTDAEFFQGAGQQFLANDIDRLITKGLNALPDAIGGDDFENSMAAFDRMEERRTKAAEFLAKKDEEQSARIEKLNEQLDGVAQQIGAELLAVKQAAEQTPGGRDEEGRFFDEERANEIAALQEEANRKAEEAAKQRNATNTALQTIATNISNVGALQ